MLVRPVDSTARNDSGTRYVQFRSYQAVTHDSRPLYDLTLRRVGQNDPGQGKDLETASLNKKRIITTDFVVKTFRIWRVN